MNVPIAVLIWLMIYPMMLKIDFGSLVGVTQRPRGLLVTLFVDWLVKPFSMALFVWLFIHQAFSAWIDPATAKNSTAGLIILAAAPCTAMVFVWTMPSCASSGCRTTWRRRVRSSVPAVSSNWPWP